MSDFFEETLIIPRLLSTPESVWLERVSNLHEGIKRAFEWMEVPVSTTVKRITNIRSDDMGISIEDEHMEINVKRKRRPS